MTTGREELRSVVDFLRKGDVLMVTRIDRLARSIGDLQDIVRALRAKGASLKATEQPIDTSTSLCFHSRIGTKDREPAKAKSGSSVLTHL
jgi:DNA invertase Pin-like site-specific DNA recombinase